MILSLAKVNKESRREEWYGKKGNGLQGEEEESGVPSFVVVYKGKMK